jgi:guanine nucleotide-binding protein G(i) subunit alpha
MQWSPGSGESGKSTIVKQMKIIHQNGYTLEELAMYRLTIYKNLVDCAKALVQALRQFNIEPESATNKVCGLRLLVLFCHGC